MIGKERLELVMKNLASTCLQREFKEGYNKAIKDCINKMGNIGFNRISYKEKCKILEELKIK